MGNLGVILTVNLDWLQKNWDVLISAPFAFVTCVVGSFVVAFAIVSYFKNSEIAILERRVTDYESKLKVGSPDEAKSKVDRLEGEIAGVNRVLTSPLENIGIRLSRTKSPI